MQDIHSGNAVILFSQYRSSLLVSSLNLLEVTNAIRLRVFRKQMTAGEARIAMDLFEDDLSSGVLRLSVMPPATWETARRLSMTHSAALGTRSLDILQVATALALEADTFLTFDHNQGVLARAEGLATPAGSE